MMFICFLAFCVLLLAWRVLRLRWDLDSTVADVRYFEARLALLSEEFGVSRRDPKVLEEITK